MNSPSSRVSQSRKSIRGSLGLLIESDIFSWDLLLGLLLGAGMGIWAHAKSGVLEEESAVLLAVSGAAVGLLAVTLAAIALLMGFLQGFYKKVIEAAGVKEFFRPFQIVAWVSGGAAIVGLAGALDSSPGPKNLRAILFGISVALFVWAVVGVVQLVNIFIDYGYEGEQLGSPTDGC